MGVMTTTVVVNGAASEAAQVVAVADKRRRYIGLYARLGGCKVSYGEGTHANDYVVIAQGNYMELLVNPHDKVSYSTTGTVLTIIQDRDSSVATTYDNLVLTYAATGLNITYNSRAVKVPPVFK